MGTDYPGFVAYRKIVKYARHIDVARKQFRYCIVGKIWDGEQLPQGQTLCKLI